MSTHQMTTTTADGDDEDETTCPECDRPEDRSSGRVIARFPRPTGGTMEACTKCYADLLAETTILSDQQTQILAMLYAGLGYAETRDALDIGEGSLNKQLEFIDGKLPRAREHVKKGSATVHVLKEFEERREQQGRTFDD